MKKILTKIIGASLAIAMMIGVGAGVSANQNKRATEAFADDTFSQSYNTSALNGKIGGSYASANGYWKVPASAGNTATVTLPFTQTYTPTSEITITLEIATFSTGNNPTSNNSTITAVGSDQNSNWSGSGVSSYPSSSTYVNGVLTMDANPKSSISGVVITMGVNTGVKIFRLKSATVSFSYSSSSQQETKYTVTYLDGGATSGSVPVDETEYDSGDTVTVLGNLNNLEKEDYTFGGWSDGAHNYDVGDTFEITSNTNLTAIWNINNTFDVLDKAFTGSPSGYTDWSNKAGTVSEAIYAGNSNGGNSSIQLRSDSGSGIVSTKSGGDVKKIVVEWNNNTSDGRVLDVYGRDYKYTSTSELYGNAKGDLLGSITKGTSTSLTINGSHRYVALRSHDGAAYLSSIYIKWEAVDPNPRIILNKTSLEIKTNQTSGDTVTAFVEDIENPTYLWTASNNNVTLENQTTPTVTIKPNTEAANSSVVTLTVGGVTPNKTASVEVTINLPNPGETAGTAFTVAQAREHIDGVITAGTSTGNDGNSYYAKGIVSEIVTPYNSQYGNITYNISADGLTTSDQLQAYRGKAAGPANFTSEDDVCVGDQVIVYGLLKKHNDGTYEFDANNQLISRVQAPKVNSISLTPSVIYVAPNAEGDIASLFTDIVINQDQGSNKTVNDIVWTSGNQDTFCPINDQFIAGSTSGTSTTIHATIGGRSYGSATVNVVTANTQTITYQTPATWLKVESLNINDKIVFVYEGNTNYEMTSVTTTGTTFGDVDEFEENPSGSYLLTVVAGKSAGSFAFKTSNNKYLSWSSGNSLTTADSVENASSWTIQSTNNGAEGRWKFVNVGTTSRILQYNASNPRFACYGNDGQTAFQIYKQTAAPTDEHINLNAVTSTFSLVGNETENGLSVSVDSVAIKFGLSISKADWNAIASALTITDYGVMLTQKSKLDNFEGNSIKEAYEAGERGFTIIHKGSGAAPYSNGDNYSFNAKVNYPNTNEFSGVACAAPFIVANGHYYFFNEMQYSVVSLADYYLANGGSSLSDAALNVLAGH